MGKAKKGPVVLTEDEAERFDKLWKAYPNKTGGKGEAKRAFLKYDPKGKELDRWIATIEKEREFKAHLSRHKRFVPEWKMLSTWINQECFDDEYPSTTDKRTEVGSDYNKQSDPAPFEKVPKVQGDV